MVEILGIDGRVHYRRPADHPDVLEALRTRGYGIKCNAGEWAIVDKGIDASNQRYEFHLSIEGEIFIAGPVGMFIREDVSRWQRRAREAA